MKGTKEKILKTALELFAESGFEAVSTGMIADRIGITKGALYRHFVSKQAIWDGIIAWVMASDASLAQFDGMPAGTVEEDENAYRQVNVRQMAAFSKRMFRYWTMDDMAVPLRRMLTLEQYRDAKMAELMEQLLTSGPIAYMADLFRLSLNMPPDEAKEKATVLCSMMYTGYTLCDHTEEREACCTRMETWIDTYLMSLKAEE